MVGRKNNPKYFGVTFRLIKSDQRLLHQNHKLFLVCFADCREFLHPNLQKRFLSILKKINLARSL